VFIPSVDRDGKPIAGGQEPWVRECLAVMGEHFGGATAFPPGLGVWRDDTTGELIYDETVVVFTYASARDVHGNSGEALFGFLSRLGRETNQGEVGVLFDGAYYGIQEF